MRRGFALALVLILVLSSLMMFKPAFAQSIPKPSVPEFTVRLIDHSYDVPITHSIDPYSGQDITNPAHHVQNYTIEMSINNQPYESYNSLYYNIRIKGHFAGDWNSPLYPSDGSPVKSNSTYTVLNFVQGTGYYFYGPNHGIIYVPSGQLDFQAKAFVGGSVFVEPSDGNPIGSGWHFKVMEESNWSNTQTISNPDGAVSISTSPNPTPTSTQNPTLTPTVPEFPSWALLLLLTTMVVAAGLLVYNRSRKQ